MATEVRCLYVQVNTLYVKEKSAKALVKKSCVNSI